MVTSKVTVTLDPAQTGVVVTPVTEIDWAIIVPGIIPRKTKNKPNKYLALLPISDEQLRNEEYIFLIKNL